MQLERILERTARIQALGPREGFDFRCICSRGASSSAIDSLEREFKIVVPSSLRELLMQSDGILLGYFTASGAPFDYIHLDSVDKIKARMEQLSELWLIDGDPQGLVVGNGTESDFLVTLDCAKRVKHERHGAPVYLVDAMDHKELQFGMFVANSIDEFLERIFDQLETSSRDFMYYFSAAFDRRMYPYDPPDRPVETSHH